MPADGLALPNLEVENPLPSFHRRVKRNFDVTDRGLRYDVQNLSATATLQLLNHRTLLKVDTTAGSATITLPPVRTVPGYELIVKKMVAGNTLTLDGNGTEQIDGASTKAWTTALQAFKLIADAAANAWVIV